MLLGALQVCSRELLLFLLPVSEMALGPFMSSECVAFPPNVGFDLPSKLVRHTAAGSPHGAERVERSEELAGVCLRGRSPPGEEKTRG